ncbi:hypothetical protein [Schaalia vaccimaxillae]|uniref:hypothetical protein n=1 Tax=Schaalia vaccimaxillae TaxID=183916 RepID=UPI0003B32315|nr:hypothetical protein [Schaalia vaccimaxillae]
MSSESTIDTESVTSASNTLASEGTPKVAEATTESTLVIIDQNPRKWGVEAGPSSFSPEYTRYLSYLETEMATMRDQLDSFIESVRQTAIAVENNETDISEAVTKVSTDLEQQPQAPVEPYGRESVDQKTIDERSNLPEQQTKNNGQSPVPGAQNQSPVPENTTAPGDRQGPIEIPVATRESVASGGYGSTGMPAHSAE